MSSEETSCRGHALNNLLGKIIGSAELALDRVGDEQARSELNAIIELAEAAAVLVRPLVGHPALGEAPWNG